MIDIREDYISDVLNDCEDLFKEHWEEIAHDKDKIKLSIDEDKYKALESIGILKTFSAFSGEDRVGYSIFMMTPHLHYKDDIFAMNDVIFIKKAYRKGTAGIKLIKFAEAWLKEHGVSVVSYHFKSTSSALPIFKRLGYDSYEVTHRKYIGK